MKTLDELDKISQDLTDDAKINEYYLLVRERLLYSLGDDGLSLVYVGDKKEHNAKILLPKFVITGAQSLTLVYIERLYLHNHLSNLLQESLDNRMKEGSSDAYFEVLRYITHYHNALSVAKITELSELISGKTLQNYIEQVIWKSSNDQQLAIQGEQP
jgi:hypothetical protein